MSKNPYLVDTQTGFLQSDKVPEAPVGPEPLEVPEADDENVVEVVNLMRDALLQAGTIVEPE